MRLSDSRYESIKRDVVKTFKECNIRDIPIDPIKIAKCLGIKLIKYSDVEEDERELLIEIEPNGFISQDRTKIFYNDAAIPGKIRYTLLHEIGHKVRNHLEDSPLAESEAEWFAAYAIAPPPLVNMFKVSEYTEIAFTFETTFDCAMHAMGRYESWKFFGNKDADYERDLLKLFEKYNLLKEVKTTWP